MGVRRPAFALVLVLILVGAVFAMTVHSAVVLRSSMSETSAVAATQSDLRTAHGAASIVLKAIGVTTAPGQEGSGDGDNPASPADRDEGMDLPPIVRQLLEAAGADLDLDSDEDEDDGLTDGEGSGDASDAQKAQPGRTTLTLPSGGVSFMLDGQRVTVELRDAAGGLNINRVDDQTLRQYLQLKGLDGTRLQSVVDQIMDWRDEDSVPRGRGMEAGGYRLRGVTPRNGPLATFEELRMLPAVTEEVYAMIREDLCLSGDAGVHLGSASEAVLRAVGGLNQAHAADIVRLRERGELTEQAVKAILGNRVGETSLRVESTPLVRIRVVVERDNGSLRVFDGMAVFSGRRVTSFGLREAAAMMAVGTIDEYPGAE